MNLRVHVSTLRIVNHEEFYREAVVVFPEPIVTADHIETLRDLARTKLRDRSAIGLHILSWHRLEEVE